MDILERIKEASRRIVEGHAIFRIPAEQTDPDIVLADSSREIRDLRTFLADSTKEIESIRTALSEKEEAINELQHYVTGHKGQLTEMNRENIRLKAALSDSQKERERLIDILEQIMRAACGEDQIAEDETGGLRYIWELSKQALGEGKK